MNMSQTDKEYVDGQVRKLIEQMRAIDAAICRPEKKTSVINNDDNVKLLGSRPECVVFDEL